MTPHELQQDNSDTMHDGPKSNPADTDIPDLLSDTDTDKTILLEYVHRVLTDAGEKECRRVRTKTTGRVLYLPGGAGDRVRATGDTPCDLIPPVKGLWYFTVGHQGHSKRILRKYRDILRGAGLPVFLANHPYHKSVFAVWVLAPFDMFGVFPKTN